MEPQITILFLCDVNVAADGHVDFKSTHYYSIFFVMEASFVDFLNFIYMTFSFQNVQCLRKFIFSLGCKLYSD